MTEYGKVIYKMLLGNAISTNLRCLVFKIFWGGQDKNFGLPLCGVPKYKTKISVRLLCGVPKFLYSTWNPLKIWPASEPGTELSIPQ